jgi:hypothetical protein
MAEKMRLGPYDIDWNPTQFTVPKKDKRYSIVQTYSSAVFFSWGLSSIGKEIMVEWEMMKEQDFDNLQELLEDDQAYLWTPVSGEAAAYNVEMCQLDGSYIDKSTALAPYRTNVKLVMMLLDEV